VVGLPEAGELASHRNIIGILGTGRSHTMQRARVSRLLERTANIQREVIVTSTFAAVTRRMVANASVPTLVPVAGLTSTAIAIADPPRAASTLPTRSKSVGFQTIAARTNILLDALNTGVAGIAPAFAACAPQACYEVFAAWKDDDQPLAKEKQERIREAARLAEATPGALKFASDLNGYFGGLPRLPHLPPTGAERAALERLMKPLRN
jgi:dihydrodipicolinate synthase/N-acetylneuraminate lyase